MFKNILQKLEKRKKEKKMLDNLKSFINDS